MKKLQAPSTFKIGSRTRTLLTTFSLLIVVTSTLLAQDVTIPDSQFLNALIGNGHDTNGDGIIQESEAEALQTLYVSGDNINDLTGIEKFINITRLFCDNNNLTSLDLSSNVFLEEVQCDENSLTDINVFQCTELKKLHCNDNELTTLILSNNSELEILDCHQNSLTSLVISNHPKLQTLKCSDNELQSLTITYASNLENIYCDENELTNIVLSGCPVLRKFESSSNQFTSLDLSYNPELVILECNLNPALKELDLSSNDKIQLLYMSDLELDYLNLKNGSIVTDFYDGNTTIKFVCLDDNEWDWAEANLSDFQNTSINTNCNFTTGGSLFHLRGLVQFDENGDCTAASSDFNILQFSINNNGTISKAKPAYDSIGYKLYLAPGDVTITPILSDNNLLEVEPSSISLTSINARQNLTQDFCISADGPPRKDMAIYIIPKETPRPGFDIEYDILIENLGSAISSGSISFLYPEELMEYLPSSGWLDFQGQLTNTYSNLLPSESLKFTVEFRVNSPMDTPPVNDGDILNLLAHVIPDKTDINLNNNNSSLRDQVVNSYDPNDKTCLQGNVIDTSMVGEYLNYRIRFENTGTASAVNITVSDSIDSAKFDINTLRVLDASHPVYSEIRGDKVEFIFENIELPFQDSINDGYVIFEIKSQEDLVIGDTLFNTADIYFDFNFPIVTNTEETLIAIDQDGDGYHNLEDCDDTNPDQYPNAPEDDCALFDYNCDGYFGGVLFYIDEDGDGFGLEENYIVDCDQNQPVGYTHQFGDCDDTNPNIYPDAPEDDCSYIDFNCDGINEGIIFYLDEDGDGFGIEENTIIDCLINAPDGYTQETGDCDDANPDIYPGATEIPYNGIDEDCDAGTLDDDLDMDGFGIASDCNDENDMVYSGAPEICDGLDNDCDELIDEGFTSEFYFADTDEDGFGDPQSQIESCFQPNGYILQDGDCNDEDPTINPDAIDIPNNGIDENCDGVDEISATYELNGNSMSIFPNPTNGSVYIEMQVEQNVVFELFNIQGKKLKQQLEKTMDLSNLVDGVYILRVTDLTTQKSVLERIVLNK